MIVGTTSIDYEIIKEFVGMPESLVQYVEDMVPSWAKHISGITDNQKYYVALHIRKMLSIPYKQRVELTDALTLGIHISGVISSVVSITDIINACDKKSLIEMLKLRLKDNERGRSL